VIVIVTHVHGDFDALAALVAASKLYPDSEVLLPEPMHANVRSFVNLYRDVLPLYKHDFDLKAVPDLAVVVDTRNLKRLGPYRSVVEKAGQIHIFDHHPHQAEDLTGDRMVVEQIGATTTLLVEEIRRRDLKLTELEASLFALGIYEDTGCLTFNGTSERDVNAVAYLWEKGVNIRILQDYLRLPLNPAQKSLLEKIFDHGRTVKIRQWNVFLSAVEVEEYVQGVGALVHYLRELENVELVLVLVQMNKSLYLAGRALDDGVDLRELLAPFGAKGHPSAATVTIKEGVLEEVREKLLELLEQRLPPKTTALQIASFPVETITADTRVSEAMELMFSRSYSGYPVLEDGKMVGIISRRDIQKAIQKGLGHAPVKGFMQRQIISASPGDSVTSMRQLMVEHNIGRLPVVDEKGDLVGIVTRSDILRTMYRLDRRGKLIPEEQPEKEADPAPEEALPPTEVDNLLPLINRKLPPRLQRLLLLVGQIAAREKVQVYLVGGMIRDLLLGWSLPQDLDFVVLSDALSFASVLQRYLGGKLQRFQQFGTATLFLEEGLRLDLVTARREFYASPAALPQVEASSLKNDLFRRDFTINTLACALNPESFGKIIDFFNGRKDLEKGLIRTLYNLSFVDDPLRILRAVRFEQRFRFTIEDNTLKMIQKAIRGRVIDKVSRQRLNHELSFIFKEDAPSAILKRLHDLKALALIYPSLRPRRSTWERLQRLDGCVKRLGNWMGEEEYDLELAYLAALIYHLRPEEQTTLVRKLRFSRERSRRVLSCCRELPAALEILSRPGLLPSELVKLLDRLPPEALPLICALQPQEKVEELVVKYLESYRKMRPLLTGHHLKELGLEPGPMYQQILAALRDAVLDGALHTLEDERRFVRAYLEKEKEA
jgi:tRNA nucleotidyltransferase (CCA-adding enzyme)